ncbi:MAG: endonuclease III [Candidatus Dormibacteraeota bacterium]|nr:endonuclease III [Candidatus Dormibacteraeota bacterium]
MAGKRVAAPKRAQPGKRRLPRGARERAGIVVERLQEEYPSAHTELRWSDPFQLLVAVILSAQTTDVQVNSVMPALVAKYPDAAALAGAAQEDVEQIVKPTGFFHVKAQSIREMAQDVLRLHDGTVPDTLDELVKLHGVGRKTANVVLGVAFGTPGFAVDTHVTRLTQRLGLTSSSDPVKIETDVTSIVPAAEWTSLSLRLILHGRRVCIARKPRCEECVLNDICPCAFFWLKPKKPGPC